VRLFAKVTWLKVALRTKKATKMVEIFIARCSSLPELETTANWKVNKNGFKRKMSPLRIHTYIYCSSVAALSGSKTHVTKRCLFMRGSHKNEHLNKVPIYTNPLYKTARSLIFNFRFKTLPKALLLDSNLRKYRERR